MDALFVVPCLVSKNVNEKIVPALAKLVERNILLNNSTLFLKAAEIKYNPRYNFKLFNKVKNESELPNMLFLNQKFLSEDFFQKFENQLLKETNDPEKERENLRREEERARQTSQAKMLMKMDQQIRGLRKAAKFTNKSLKTQKSVDPQARADIRKAQADLQNAITNLANLEKSFNLQTAEESKKKLEKLENDILKTTTDILNSGNLKDKTKIEIEKIKADLEAQPLANYKTKAEADNKRAGTEKTKWEIQKIKDELKTSKQKQKMVGKGWRGNAEYQTKNVFSKIDDIEHAPDIRFFNQISVEPTILEIPISFFQTNDPSDGTKTMVFKIGIKCIPYTIGDLNIVKKIMREARLLTTVESKFKAALRKLDLYKFWKRDFSIKRDIKSGNLIDPKEVYNMIVYSPNMNEINSPKKLAALFDYSRSSPWMTMVILSSYDLTDEELADTVRNYRKMTNSVLGDIIITNETKESAFFCTTKLGACQEFQFDYLRKIMNLDNIIDASVVSRMAKPFSASKSAGPIQKLADSFSSDVKTENVDIELNNSLNKLASQNTYKDKLNKINNILRG